MIAEINISTTTNITRVLWSTAGNGLPRVFRTPFERGDVFKMKAAEPEEQNIPLDLCSSRGAGKMTFQNQPQDYVTI